MANSSNYQIVKQDIVGFYFATLTIYVNEKFSVLFSRFDTEYSNHQEQSRVCLDKYWSSQPGYPGAGAEVLRLGDF